MSIMTHEGYDAIVENDEKTGSFHGEVLNALDVITLEDCSVEGLKQALDDDIEYPGVSPNKRVARALERAVT